MSTYAIVQSFSPFSRILASVNTVVSSKVTKFADSGVNGGVSTEFAESRSASQIPSSDLTTSASLNGKTVASFIGPSPDGNHYISNSSAATWNFLHQNAKSEVFIIGLSDANTRFELLATNFANHGNPGTSFRAPGAASNTGAGVAQAGGADGIGCPATGGVGYWANFTLDRSHTSQATDFVIRQGGFTPQSGSITDTAGGLGTLNSSNAGTPLTLGSNWVDPTNFAEIIVFNRMLSATERNQVLQYIKNEYGLTYPDPDLHCNPSATSSLTITDGTAGNVAVNYSLQVSLLNPFSRIRVKENISSGGKATEFLELSPVNPSHTLTQASSTLQSPTPIGDSRLNGRELLILGSTHKYVSSFAASAWAFLHKDGPKEVIYIGVIRNTSGSVFSFSTRDVTAGNVGFAASIQALGKPNFAASNATAANSITDATGYALDSKFYADFAGDISLSPDMNLVTSEHTTQTGNYTVSGSTSNPQFTMQLGTIAAAPGETGFAEWIIFDRTLSQAERDVIRRYVKSYYGIESGLTPGEFHPNGVNAFAAIGKSIANMNAALSGVGSLPIVGKSIANAICKISSDDGFFYGGTNFNGSWPPSGAAIAIPTFIQNGRWRFSFTQTAITNGMGQDNPFLFSKSGVPYVSPTTYIFLSSPTNLRFICNGVSVGTRTVSITPNSPTFIEVNLPAASWTLSGFASGNGTFALNGGIPFTIPSGNYNFGHSDVDPTWDFVGTFTNPEEWQTGTPINVGVLTSVGSSISRALFAAIGASGLATVGSSTAISSLATSGNGILAATGRSIFNASGAFTGSSGVTSIGSGVLYGSCGLTGTSSLAATGQAATAGVSALVGTGVMAAAGFAFSYKLDLFGFSTVGFTGQSIFNGSTSFSCTSFMVIFTTSRCQPTASGSLSAVGSSTADAQLTSAGLGLVSVAGSSTADATCTTVGSGGTLTIGRSSWNAATSWSESSTLSISPSVVFGSVGTSALTSIGVAGYFGTVAPKGTGTLTALVTVLVPMTGTGTFISDSRSKGAFTGVGALAVKPYITCAITSHSVMFCRQVSFGFQDNSYNLLSLPAIAEMLGWEEIVIEDEQQQLDIYLFLIESIRIEDQNSGAFFLKRFLQGPQEVWNKTQKKIFSLKELWDIQNIPSEYLVYMKTILGWTPEYDSITNSLSTTALRRLLISSIAIWKSRGTEDSLVNIIAFMTKTPARVFDWFYYRWIIDENSFDFASDPSLEASFEPWVMDDVGSQTYALRIVDDGAIDRDLVRSLAKAMRPVGERIEIDYLMFMDYFDEDENPYWQTYGYNTQSIKIGTYPQSTIFASAPGWMRDGTWRVTFQPNFNSASITPFIRQMIVGFAGRTLTNSLGQLVYSTAGIAIEGNSVVGFNLVVRDLLGTHQILQAPITFLANSVASIDVDTSGILTLSGFATGNGTFPVAAWSFGADIGMTVGKYFSTVTGGFTNFNGVVVAINRVGFSDPIDQAPITISADRCGQLLSTDNVLFAQAQIFETQGILSEYLVSAKIRSDGGWRFGVAFYVEDQNNFHMVYADVDNRWHLCETIDGGTVEIASGANPGGRKIFEGVWYQVRIQVVSTTSDLVNSIMVYIDESLVISATDDSLFGGSIAIVKLNKDTAVSFTDVEIMSLPAVTNDFVDINS